MSATSSPTKLQQIIQEYNPFDGHFVAKTQQVWGEGFPDVPLINKYASDLVLETVQKVDRGILPVGGILLLAPKGVGKTHVLSRIRHQLQTNGNGLFIYMNEYGDLARVKFQFLQSLVTSLKKMGSQEVLQCQKLATALVCRALNKSYVPKQIVNRFLDTLSTKPWLVDHLTQKVLELPIDIDNPYIVRAIIWTLSHAHAPYAFNWLAGREITDAQAKVLGLPNSTQEDKEPEAFKSALQILNLIGYCMTPVICFDELDGAEIGGEDDLMYGGFTRAMVVASLAKDVYNNLKRGVLVTAMYPRTWTEQVQPLATADAVIDRIAQKSIYLDLVLKPDDVIALVSRWLVDFYSKHNIVPPNILYPYSENKLREFGKSGPTVREVLRWCSDNFGTVEDDPIKKVERVYKEIESGIEDFSENNETIAKALIFAMRQLQGQSIEGVTITQVESEVLPKQKNNGYIQLKIIGQEDGKTVKIGVSVLQNSHGKGVGAGLKRLVQYKTFDLTRGCLLRNKDIKEAWSAYEKLQELQHNLGGEWVSFEDSEIKPLIALREIAKDLEEYGISQDLFKRFIQESGKISSNEVVQEILSDPSGQSPANIHNEDQNLIELPISSDSISDISDDYEEFQ